jgi:O-antigen/teichoic acid export membrane protein
VINPSTSPSHLPPDEQRGAGESRVGRRVLVNTSALTGASLWRIATSFVLQVFVARQLDVPGVGIYNAALAYINVGQVISEIGLPGLLVRNLAQNPHHRRAVFFMSLRLQLIMGLVVWAGLAGFAMLLEPTSRMALWIVGASLPFYAVTSASQTIFQAAERMELLMSVESVINALALGASLAVLFSGGDILALVTVLVAAQALSALLCAILLQHSRLLRGEQVSVSFSYRELWQQAVPFFRLSIADVLLQRLDILLLTVLAGEVVTGIYSLAYNLVRVLTKLIQSFWQALYPTFSRLYHQDDPKYAILTNLSLRYGLTALLPVALLSAVVAPEFLPFIFSAEYIESASVYRVLVWLAPFFFLASYASTVLMVQRRPKASLLIAAAHLATLLVLLPVLAGSAQADGAAWAAMLAAMIGCLTGMHLLRRYELLPVFPKVWPLALAGLVATLLALFTPAIWPLRVLAGSVGYLAIAWQLGAIIPEDIRAFRRALTTPLDNTAP